MDLRKVFDQTVRDLKREVNKKVLKVPEIEQKVLDATSNEPWGPHGTVMAELAQATRNYNDYQMIMSIIWKRLADTGRNWRHVYKGLTIFDYLVAHGADRVIDELREHVFQIQGLIDFQYVEPNGKDQGVNVRKKAQALVSLLNDKEKIREVRQKAAANRDKYQGYSSTGGIYKPSSYSSTGTKGFSDWDTDRNGYGGREDRFGTFDEDRYGKAGDRHNDSYQDQWQEREETTRSFEGNDESDYTSSAANRTTAGSKKTTVPTYEQTQKKHDKTSGPVRALNPPASGQNTTALDDDDFDPRAPAPAPGPSASAAPEVDLLQLDFFSTAPNVDPFAEHSSQSSSVSKDGASDPFGSGAASDAFGTASDFGAFTSAPSAPTTGGGDFFASDPFNQLTGLQSESKPAASSAEFNAFDSAQPSSTTFDPFAPTSQTSFNAFSDVPPATTTAPSAVSSSLDPTFNAQNKQTFQTKSSVWADSLTSGLIDLNITAPKSTSLAELGIQFDNHGDWSKEQSSLKGRAMGSGSGLGLAGANGLGPPPASSTAGFGFNSSAVQPPSSTAANAGFFSTPMPPQHDQFDFGSFK